MTTTTKFTIEEDGLVYKDVLQRTPIDLTPELERVFQSNATLKLRLVADMGELCDPCFGEASLAHASGTFYWSVRILTLNLNTAFVLNKDKELVPSFEEWADTEKVMQIGWKVPDEITLVLGITMIDLGHGFQSGKHYLVAYDTAKRSYRLPLTNLYDHLELCHGQGNKEHTTPIGSLITALKAFRSSLWNADLCASFQRTNAPLMFRFKPTDKGFDQLPINDGGHGWQWLCEKVSNDLINSKFNPPLL